MPRKTVHPDEGATTNELVSLDPVRVAPHGSVDAVDEAMRKHGAHVWHPKGQNFWCFCDRQKNHAEEPRWA